MSAEFREQVMKMTPQERLELSLWLGDEYLAELTAATGMSREEALAYDRKQAQLDRPRPSRSKGGW